jgi:hypothetical protein
MQIDLSKGKAEGKAEGKEGRGEADSKDPRTPITFTSDSNDINDHNDTPAKGARQAPVNHSNGLAEDVSELVEVKVPQKKLLSTISSMSMTRSGGSSQRQVGGNVFMNMWQSTTASVLGLLGLSGGAGSGYNRPNLRKKDSESYSESERNTRAYIDFALGHKGDGNCLFPYSQRVPLHTARKRLLGENWQLYSTVWVGR